MPVNCSDIPSDVASVLASPLFNMLRAWIPQGAWHIPSCEIILTRSVSARAAVASTSNNPSLHTSAVLSAESARKRIARADKKVNLRKREERLAYAAANRPHVVLGTRPGEDHKWTDSDLAKCVLTEESILASGEPVLSVRGPIGEVPLPAHLNYGVTEPDARLLFSTLPALAGEVNADEKRIREHRRDALFEGDARKLAQVAEQAQAEEQRKAEMLARVVDLRNANAGGIAYENRRRIVEAFSEPGKPGDTGRTEVQGAYTFSTLSLTRNAHGVSRHSCHHDDENSQPLDASYPP